MAYWPDTPDRRTSTFWLAIDDSTIENGCMRFVPATNREARLRPHAPVFGGRGTSHALGTDLRDRDRARRRRLHRRRSRSCTGTHKGPWQGLAPTGRTMRIDEVYFFRVTDNRLSGIWGLEDTWTRHRQLRGSNANPENMAHSAEAATGEEPTRA